MMVVYGGKVGGAKEIVVNYKFKDEFSKAYYIKKYTFSSYCKLLNIRFANLLKLLDCENIQNKELKDAIALVNNMIIQLNKAQVEDQSVVVKN